MEELAIALSLLGFQPAGQTTLSRLLRNVSCTGSTAFRDAVVKGMSLMIELYGVFAKLNMQNFYKFVHVVLTDGEDNSSQVNQNSFLEFQRLLNRQLSSEILQTFYIGVDVENNQRVRQEMADILRCSQNNSQYYSINSNGINDIFQKIQMQIGLRVQQQQIVIQNNQGTFGLMREQVQPVFNVQVNHYIVLFTLDISGSMSSNWGKVCAAVDGFLDNLGNEDLVMGITFNDQVSIITQPQTQNNNRQQITYNNNQTYSRSQSSQKNYQVKDEGYCCSIM